MLRRCNLCEAFTAGLILTLLDNSSVPVRMGDTNDALSMILVKNRKHLWMVCLPFLRRLQATGLAGMNIKVKNKNRITSVMLVFRGVGFYLY